MECRAENDEEAPSHCMGKTRSYDGKHS